MTTTTLYASCRVGDLMIGVDVERVQEVHAGSRLTPVPLAPPLVSGLLNLRGEIVTAIDLRRCLQQVERPPDQRPVDVIVRTPDGCVSLLADDVGDVLTMNAADLTPPTAALHRQFGALIAGVFALGDGRLLVLDLDRLLTISAGEPLTTNRRIAC